ncbi:MAG: DUF4358 domain-containing protein [Clostridia bacterium]|nr:DUF4358 domain-containing protein [Clostridia bacterium]
MKKLTAILILTILTAVMFGSCGEGNTYKTDVAAADISAAYKPLIENGSALTEMTADYVNSSMQIPTDKCSEFVVCVPAAGATFDEYGIFKAAAEADVETIITAVEEYIARRAGDKLALSYVEEDAPNVTGAEVKVAGLYITYAMLDEAESSAVYEAFEAALKQN